jgi:hypothetical protein
MVAINKQRWLALSPLLDEWLDIDVGERTAWLAKIQREDASLGADLVELLASYAHVETAHFLEGSALASQEIGNLAGQVVGSYTLERPLGHGGMGSVWLARRSDGRYEGLAAVKFLNLALMGSGGLARFQREGSVLARLTHPCIARLLDAGVFAGQPYLVLEYVEGQRIDHYCDSHALAVDARVRLFLDVLTAVEHAHQNLILHCDLKPNNILVTRDGSVKLLDFGIAKLMRDETLPAGATELTQAGARGFTPEYAAPEQLQGGDVTTATDVCALGVLLHVLLVGSYPTLRKAGTPVEQLRALVEAEPARASDMAQTANSDGALARILRGDLDNILAKALKRNPAERYATVNAFATDLRHYLNHEPVAARPDSLAYHLRKFVRRNRLAVGAASVTLLALVGGVVGTTWQAIEARRAQARAEANAAEARQQKTAAEFETRVARANHEFVSQLFGDAMRGGESERMQKRLDRAHVMLQRRYQDDPQVHALLLLQLAGRYAELRDDKREAQVMQELEALVQRHAIPSLQAELQCIHAYDLMRERKLDEAKPFLERGLAYSKLANKPLDDLECVRADSMMSAFRKDPVRAQKRMNDFLVVLERGGRGKSRAYLSTLGSLAYVQALADELAPSLATTRRAIELDVALGSADTLSSVVDFDRMATMQLELGRFAEADVTDLDLVRRFAEAEEEMPNYQLAFIARRALFNGKTPQAIKILQSVLARFEEQGPEASARNAMVDLIDAYSLLHRTNEARDLLRRYESRVAAAPPSTTRNLQLDRLQALLAIEHQDLASAHAHGEALVSALEVADNMRRPGILKSRLDAGWIFLHTGDLDKALQQGEWALVEGRRKTLDNKPSAWVGAASLLLSQVYAKKGETAQADASLALARQQLEGAVAPGHPLLRSLETPGAVRTF